MTIIDYEAGTLKDMGKASAKVVTMGDKTSMKITLEPGFDWIKEVSPKLPGCPVWCPANHFGYLEKGTMKVKYEDGPDITVNAGESYNIPPGHLPEVIGDVPWYADISFPVPLLVSAFALSNVERAPRARPDDPNPGRSPSQPASWSSSRSPPPRSWIP
jgi:hypothetical protein